MSENMKVFVLVAEHFEVPIRIVEAYASKAAANVGAAQLTNIMLKDNGSKWVAKPNNWRRYLKLVQQAVADQDCGMPYIDITGPLEVIP